MDQPYSPPKIEPYAPVQQDLTPQDAIQQLPGHGLTAVIAITIGTFGLYVPIWYMRSANALNALSGSEKKIVNRGLAIAYLALYAVILAASLASGFLDGATGYADATRSLNGFLRGTNLPSAVMTIVLAFQGRRALALYHARIGQTQVRLSGVATFFLGIFYLQYRVDNLRMHAAKAGPAEPA